MMTLTTEVILDSCVLFDFFRREAKIVEWVYKVRPSRIAITSIIHLEILGTASKKQAKDQLAEALRAFVYAPHTEQTNSIAKNVFRNWNSGYTKPKIPDLLIGCAALQYGLPVATYNFSDFQGIPDLRIIDPRDPQ